MAYSKMDDWLLCFQASSGDDHFRLQVCSGSVCHGHALHLKAGLGPMGWFFHWRCISESKNLRQNVATIIVLMLCYDQWYSIRKSIVPAGKEMTQIISKRLGIKTCPPICWRSTALNDAKSLIPNWASLSYVVASWTWCFFSAWTIYIYIIGVNYNKMGRPTCVFCLFLFFILVQLQHEKSWQTMPNKPWVNHAKDWKAKHSSLWPTFLLTVLLWSSNQFWQSGYGLVDFSNALAIPPKKGACQYRNSANVVGIAFQCIWSLLWMQAILRGFKVSWNVYSYWGKLFNLTNVFQMGCNYQLVYEVCIRLLFWRMVHRHWTWSF